MTATPLDVVFLATIRVGVVPVVRIMQRGVMPVYFAHFVHLIANAIATKLHRWQDENGPSREILSCEG